MIKVAAPVGVAQELVPVCIFHLFWPKSLGENNWSNGRRILFSSIILSSLVYAHPFFVQQFEGPAILIQNFCLGHHNSSSFCSPFFFVCTFSLSFFAGCLKGIVRVDGPAVGRLALVPVCHTTRPPFVQFLWQNCSQQQHYNNNNNWHQYLSVTQHGCFALLSASVQFLWQNCAQMCKIVHTVYIHGLDCLERPDSQTLRFR